MTAATTARLICAVLFIVAAGICVYLFAIKEVRMGVKMLWIAGLIFSIAVRPSGLPFLSDNPSTLSFFRIAFFSLFVVLLTVTVFVVFWIQIPQERHPRFEGVVIGYADVGGHSIPQVEYRDRNGEKIIFLDKYASYLFPKRTFKTGEHVTVIAVDSSSVHIDYSFFSRWDTAIFLMFATAMTLAFAVICHVRILQNVG